MTRSQSGRSSELLVDERRLPQYDWIVSKLWFHRNEAALMFLLLHRRSRRHPRGFTFLSVLMVLAIIAIMSQQYFATDPLTGEPFAVTQMERTRQTMELANLRTAKASYMMKTEGRTPDINRLRRVLKELPGAGGEGRYFVDPITHQLQSTSQMEMPDFRERLGLDIER